MAEWDIVGLEDLKKIERKINRVPTKFRNKVFRKALRAGAKTSLAAVKSKTPEKSGRLREGLTVRAGKRSRGVISVVIKTPSRDKLGIAADDKSYYPAAVEFGHGNVPAIPYMRGGLDESRQAALQVIKASIRSGVEREVRRL